MKNYYTRIQVLKFYLLYLHQLGLLNCFGLFDAKLIYKHVINFRAMVIFYIVALAFTVGAFLNALTANGRRSKRYF